MEKFFSCDWGTSHFRLRLVDAVSQDILATHDSKQGIADCFAMFNQSRWDEKERRSFYLAIVQRHITAIAQESGSSVEGIPVVISGMASSSIGMVELPYKQLPFASDGSDLSLYFTPPGPQLKHHVLIISGAATGIDAMRGEETQLVGCPKSDGEEQLYIFPGTHSKHVIVKEGMAVAIRTFMTGEFFALLSSKSILAGSLHEGEGLEHAHNHQWFARGVNAAASGNLLHTAFMVRTNDLFKKCTKEENYYYLSGLLIGSEMKELLQTTAEHATLVCNETLRPFYMTAREILDLSLPIHFQRDDEALIQGQLQLLARGSVMELPA